MKLALWAALVAILIAGAVGASQKKKEQQKAVDSGAAIDVTAEQIYDAYKANEVAADNAYRDKVLRVTGVVSSIQKDFTDNAYVVLRTTNEFSGVHAKFREQSGLATLSTGQHITIRCRGDNVIIGSPMLRDCVLQ